MPLARVQQYARRARWDDAAQAIRSRKGAGQWLLAGLLALAAGALGLVAIARWAPALSALAARLPTYQWTVAVGVALLGGFFAARHIRRQQTMFANSWLAAQPIAVRSSTLFWGWRLLRGYSFSVVFTLTVLLAAGVSRSHLGSLLLVAVAGAAGLALGWLAATSGALDWLVKRRWLAARRRAARSRMQYRLVPGSGTQALARLVMRRVAERCDGRTMALVVTPVLVMLPGGIGPGIGLAVVLLWVVVFVGVQILSESSQVPLIVAQWLAATPAAWRTLLWRTLWRPLGVWSLLVAIVLAVTTLLDWRLADGLVAAVVGTGLAGLWVSIGLAFRHRGVRIADDMVQLPLYGNVLRNTACAFITALFALGWLLAGAVALGAALVLTGYFGIRSTVGQGLGPSDAAAGAPTVGGQA